jgi:Domain of unknown function (DUF4156)
MKLYKNVLVFSAFVMVFYGCASQLIEVKQGSEHVSVADANQVASCESNGKATVSVLTKVGFISRSVDAVEDNLVQLARNSALDIGGDTIVKDEMPEFGKRTFAIYKCKP